MGQSGLQGPGTEHPDCLASGGECHGQTPQRWHAFISSHQCERLTIWLGPVAHGVMQGGRVCVGGEELHDKRTARFERQRYRLTGCGKGPGKAGRADDDVAQRMLLDDLERWRQNGLLLSLHRASDGGDDNPVKRWACWTSVVAPPGLATRTIKVQRCGESDG